MANCVLLDMSFYIHVNYFKLMSYLLFYKLIMKIIFII